MHAKEKFHDEPESKEVKSEKGKLMVKEEQQEMMVSKDRRGVKK